MINFREILWPPLAEGDYLAAARARLLAMISLLAGGLGFLSAVLSGIKTFEVAPVLSVVGAIAPLSFLAIPFIAHYTNRRGFAALILLTLLYTDILFISTSSGGSLSTTAFYLPSIPLLAALLIGFRYGIGAAIVVIATYVWLSPKFLDGWFSFTLSFLTIAITAAICVFQREMENSTASLIEARMKADAGNHAKSVFLANMSHEIRTPLNGVMGMAQILASSDLNTDQKQYANTILKSGGSLLAVINDILDISRIEENEVRIQHKPFDMATLAFEACETVKGVALHKGVALDCKVHPDVEGRYLGDEKKLRQILINFIGNAVKFTDEGSVELGIDKTETGSIRFQVKDTGPGVAIDQQAHLFERFKQADNSATRKYGGAGLGLAISKELAVLMGGQVGVESAPGKGSVFWLEAPFEETTAAIESPETSMAAPAMPEKTVRVLIVEDNFINRSVVAAAFKGCNIRYAEAENGAEAIALLEKGERFDLILLDVQMPIMPGEETLRRIRDADAEYANTPVVMLSANAEKEIIDDFLALGADGYLAKPVNIPHLNKTVLQYALAGMRDASKTASSNYARVAS